MATGEVLYDCKKGHSATEVLRFFKLIDLHVPRDLETTGDAVNNVDARRARNQWQVTPHARVKTNRCYFPCCYSRSSRLIGVTSAYCRATQAHHVSVSETKVASGIIWEFLQFHPAMPKSIH